VYLIKEEVFRTWHARFNLLGLYRSCWWLFDPQYQSVGTGKPRHRHKQAVPNTMRFVISADSDLSIFRRTQASTFKGLLSIPSDGRGARRPLGQSFRESVGPAALYR